MPSNTLMTELTKITAWICSSCLAIRTISCGTDLNTGILTNSCIEVKVCVCCGQVYNDDDALARTVEAIGKVLMGGYRRTPSLRQSQDSHILSLERIRIEMSRRDAEESKED